MEKSRAMKVEALLALCVQMLAKGMVSAVLHFRSQGLES